ITFARGLLDGDDAALRQHVVEALVDRPGRGGGAMTPEWIDARIQSGTQEDILQAAQALGALAGPARVERLRTLLAHPDVEIRPAALGAAAWRSSTEV